MAKMYFFVERYSYSGRGIFLVNRQDSKIDSSREVQLVVTVNGHREETADDSPGLTSAFEKALRKVLKKHYPEEIKKIRLVDYYPKFYDVENQGSDAMVMTAVVMTFNGKRYLFEGEKDADANLSGFTAIIKGYQECLVKIFKKKAKQKEAVQV